MDVASGSPDPVEEPQMPITPFHFGPGTLLKAVAPRHVSLTAFVLSQVVIDVESGYHLLVGDWPVHRICHTLPVAGLIGAVSGTVVWLVARLVPVTMPDEKMIRSEVEFTPAHLGGVIGGLSHPLLDGIMHADVKPFWPLVETNPLLGLVGLGQLHLLCLAAGVLGVGVLWLRKAMA